MNHKKPVSKEEFVAKMMTRHQKPLPEAEKKRWSKIEEKNVTKTKYRW